MVVKIFGLALTANTAVAFCILQNFFSNVFPVFKTRLSEN